MRHLGQVYGLTVSDSRLFGGWARLLAAGALVSLRRLELRAGAGLWLWSTTRTNLAWPSVPPEPAVRRSRDRSLAIILSPCLIGVLP